MPNRSKQKGDRYERQIVNDLRESGFEAERTLERGARSDGTPTWDIDLKALGSSYRGECKSYGANSFKTDYKWLEGVDFVFKKANNKSTIVMMDYDLFKELISGL